MPHLNLSAERILIRNLFAACDLDHADSSCRLNWRAAFPDTNFLKKVKRRAKSACSDRGRGGRADLWVRAALDILGSFASWLCCPPEEISHKRKQEVDR